MSLDRRQRLLAQEALDGIDYVEVADASQTVLHVHFLKRGGVAGMTVTGVRIHGGDTLPSVEVRPPVEWITLDGERILRARVDRPGDFSWYTLTLEGEKLDPFLREARFSFKAGCPTDLDCRPRAPTCPEDRAAPPIDYLAKDFASFKQALLDFSSLRHPAWHERGEADFGVMFLEALASLADDLSYTQDRVGWEAYLDTATQRRSLARIARLVDYEPTPATAAQVLLCLDTRADADIPAGLAVSARGPDGEEIPFETGEGLGDTSAYPVRASWSELTPHVWDQSARCLAVGATSMWVQRPSGAPTFLRGQRLVIESERGPGEAPLREFVELVDDRDPGEDAEDPLSTPSTVTRISWKAAGALKHAHDLERTRVRGNVVPASQGRTVTERFVIPGGTASTVPETIVRTGANGSTQHLFPLLQAPLAWRPPTANHGAFATPEIDLLQWTSESDAERRRWSFLRTLIDASTPEAAEVFTVDPSRYSRVGVDRAGGSFWDYDGDVGDTIRFGDGVFGAIPAAGDVFEVTYRVGAGAAGNVAPDSVCALGEALAALGVTRVSNPFAGVGGADREAADRVRTSAPQAFRMRPLRAVRPEDYQTAAETLPWAQRAGVTVRHSGSWLTTFVAVDPRDATTLTEDQHLEAARLLDRRRLAGRECFVAPPRYCSLDLFIEVCARPEALRGDVKQAVLDALDARRRPDGSLGFFHPDRFTFGTPLERSALEAAVQRAHGVDGVRAVACRQRGRTEPVDFRDRIEVGLDEVLRVENDPNHPERGSITVSVKGGR